MNGFLLMGIVCTAVLIVAIAFDGIDEAFDALDFGPTWLSLPVIAGFLGAFGFGTGAFIDALGPLALLPGLVMGAAFAWLAARFTSAVIHMPTGRTDTEVAMLGSLGRVVTSPTPDRYGEVLLSRPTGPLKVACTASVPIAVGTEVVVVDVVSSTLVTVEPFDTYGIGEAPVPAIDPPA
jgi:hypothetical protein